MQEKARCVEELQLEVQARSNEVHLLQKEVTTKGGQKDHLKGQLEVSDGQCIILFGNIATHEGIPPTPPFKKYRE